jgi:hypothetical protein
MAVSVRWYCLEQFGVTHIRYQYFRMSYHHLQGSLMWRRMQQVVSLPQVTYHIIHRQRQCVVLWLPSDVKVKPVCVLQNTGTHLPDITQQNALWIFNAVWYFRSTCVSPFDVERHLACSQISEAKALAVVIVFLCLSNPWHFLKFSYAPFEAN